MLRFLLGAEAGPGPGKASEEDAVAVRLLVQSYAPCTPLRALGSAVTSTHDDDDGPMPNAGPLQGQEFLATAILARAPRAATPADRASCAAAAAASLWLTPPAD